MSQTHAATLRLTAYAALALATWSTLNWGSLSSIRCSVLDGGATPGIQVTRDGQPATGVRWCRETDGVGPDLPLVTSGRVIVRHEDELLALEPRSGRERWSASVAGHNGLAPVPHRRTVIVAGQKGSLTALSVESGRAAWSLALAGGDISGLRLAGDLLLATLWSGRKNEAGATVVALDATSGHLLWRRPLLEPGAAHLVSGDPVVVLVRFGQSPDREHSVFGLDRETGRSLWSIPMPGRTPFLPIMAGRSLVTADRHGRVYAIDPLSGLLAWTLDVGGAQSTLQPAGDGLYVVTSEYRVLAVDPASGRIRWGVQGSAVRPNVWELAGRTFVTGDGAVRALNSLTGEDLWYRPLDVNRNRPLRAYSEDGRLIVTSDQDGLLLALEPETGQLLGSVEVGMPVRWMAPLSGLTFVAGWDDVLYAIPDF